MTKNLWLLLGALVGVASIGCQSGGIGDPCIPEEEYDQDFAGFSGGEISVESRSFQCKSRVCLVANFQGRTSCPYGQPDPATSSDPQKRCYLPGTKAEAEPQGQQFTSPDCKNCVRSAVSPQKIPRPPESAVYCSCRCAGPDSNVRYCECPSGYSCEELISQFGVKGGGGQLVGSYCVKDNTRINSPSQLGEDCPSDPKSRETGGCGAERHPAGI